MKLLSKQFDPDNQQQQQVSETQQEEADLVTSVPMYGRVVSNPSELSVDSLLNRRRITIENLDKLHKLAGTELGYD